jgi:hypothetical protein
VCRGAHASGDAGDGLATLRIGFCVCGLRVWQGCVGTLHGRSALREQFRVIPRTSAHLELCMYNSRCIQALSMQHDVLPCMTGLTAKAHLRWPYWELGYFTWDNERCVSS